jgi:hypothetical protein
MTTIEQLDSHPYRLTYVDADLMALCASILNSQADLLTLVIESASGKPLDRSQAMQVEESIRMSTAMMSSMIEKATTDADDD